MRKNGVKTNAVVVDVLSEKDDSFEYKSIIYIPVLSFYVNERQYIVKCNGRSYSKYSIGDKLDIIYNIKDPNKIKIKGDNKL